MISLISIAVGLGLGAGLLTAEIFGLSAGGMVASGYVALFLNRPLELCLTLLASFITVLVVSAFSRTVVLYGRRQITAMIIIGYLVGLGLNLMLKKFAPEVLTMQAGELETIGYIIPGLIAIWIERQGLVPTVSALLICSAVVRLILILIMGQDLAPPGAAGFSFWTAAP